MVEDERDDGQRGEGQTRDGASGGKSAGQRGRSQSGPRPRHKGLLVSCCIALILAVLAVTVPMPFVALSPGPTFDVTGSIDGSTVIEISGTDPHTGKPVQTYPPAKSGGDQARSGELRMVTIYENGGPGHRLNFIDLISSLLTPHIDVGPYGDYYPPDVSGSQLDQIAQAQMVSSQSAASVSALTQLGWKVPSTVTIMGSSPAAEVRGTVKEGDILVSLRTPDGVDHIVDAAGVPLSVMRTQPEGSLIIVTVKRDGKNIEIPVVSHTERELEKRLQSMSNQSQDRDGHQEQSRQGGSQKDAQSKQASSAKITSSGGDDQHDGSRLGLFLSNDVKMPFDVTVHLENVGGPSAGLMFALGIINDLTPGDMTGGALIAGTGSITYDAHVEPIGGIKQKMWGAHSDGAQWFFAPSKNCDEVIGNIPDGLRVVKVSTLSQAVDAVKSIAAHQTDHLPTCQGSH